MSMKEKFKSTTMLLDTYLLLAVGFVSLFVIAFLLIKPTVDPAKDIEMDEQLLIKLLWDPLKTNDIDLWIEHPDGDFVSYMKKEHASMTLERDDRGIGVETVILNGKETPVYDNTEVIRIKKLTDGVYYINVHFYSENGCGCSIEDVKVEVYDGVKHKTLAMYTDSVVIYGETPIMKVVVKNGKIVEYGESEYRFVIDKRSRNNGSTNGAPYGSSPGYSPNPSNER